VCLSVYKVLKQFIFDKVLEQFVFVSFVKYLNKRV